jgi:hypothetical protein
MFFVVNGNYVWKMYQFIHELLRLECDLITQDIFHLLLELVRYLHVPITALTPNILVIVSFKCDGTTLLKNLLLMK